MQTYETLSPMEWVEKYFDYRKHIQTYLSNPDVRNMELIFSVTETHRESAHSLLTGLGLASPSVPPRRTNAIEIFHGYIKQIEQALLTTETIPSRVEVLRTFLSRYSRLSISNPYETAATIALRHLTENEDFTDYIAFDYPKWQTARLTTLAPESTLAPEPVPVIPAESVIEITPAAVAAVLQDKRNFPAPYIQHIKKAARVFGLNVGTLRKVYYSNPKLPSPAVQEHILSILLNGTP